MFEQISSYCRFLLIAVSFLGVLFFLFKARQGLWAEFRNVPFIYFLGLAFLVLVPAFFYTYLIYPKHVIDDEGYYQLVAKNILTMGNWDTIPKSGGWVFLIFLGDLFTGINNYTSIWISQILGAGSIVGVFFLSFWAGLSLRVSIIAAALFCFVPSRIFWAATGESHTASVFFVIWAVAFTFLIFRDWDRKICWLAISFWVFAGQVRSETVLLFIFFFICVRLFIPKYQSKELPFTEALFWAAILLMPQIILGIEHVFLGHWVVTGFNVSIENFLHNSRSYGINFLIGQAHPVLLTLSAMLGLAFIYQRNKKTAIVLAGWFFIIWLTYFSMWFQNYGNSSGILVKTRIFVFFYPPLVLCSAFGIVWVADKCAFRFGAIVAVILCLIIISLSIMYYNEYISSSDGSVLEMHLVDDIGHWVTPQDMVVTCLPGTFTGALPHFIATDSLWFLQQPLWRSSAFKQARKVYLIDDIVSQRECRDMDSLIRDKGKAVLVKRWTRGDSSYAIYTLSVF